MVQCFLCFVWIVGECCEVDFCVCIVWCEFYVLDGYDVDVWIFDFVYDEFGQIVLNLVGDLNVVIGGSMFFGYD